MTTDDIERTERARILKLVRSELSFARIGRVRTVWTHTDPSDSSNHEVDVAIPPGEPLEEPRRIPVLQPATGGVYVPKEGDLVRVSYLDGDGDRPIVDGVVYGDADADRAPLAGEGDIRLFRGELGVELAGDGSHARLTKRADGNSEPTAAVTINDRGAIKIESTGDITVSAGGDVVVDEGGTAKPVARQDHTHPYSWGDSAGSGDTGKPNESGTKTQIE